MLPITKIADERGAKGRRYHGSVAGHRRRPRQGIPRSRLPRGRNGKVDSALDRRRRPHSTRRCWRSGHDPRIIAEVVGRLGPIDTLFNSAEILITDTSTIGICVHHGHFRPQRHDRIVHPCTRFKRDRLQSSRPCRQRAGDAVGRPRIRHLAGQDGEGGVSSTLGMRRPAP
jgi:hypothetical protein